MDDPLSIISETLRHPAAPAIEPDTLLEDVCRDSLDLVEIAMVEAATQPRSAAA